MKLYSYFRSSAAFRVRIGLNLKGITYEQVTVSLPAGDQFKPEFSALNPQSLVPVLIDGDKTLYQSLAILQYLDETHPEPPLLPKPPPERNRVRSLALICATEIHPLNNLRVLKYLTNTLGLSEEQKNAWYRHWVDVGLTALERRLASEPATGKFCHGDSPGFADVSLVPQVFNAQRFDCPLQAFPTIRRIFDACMELDAFQRAAPMNQPDAV
jgi:maleylacetoacetate isomerase